MIFHEVKKGFVLLSGPLRLADAVIEVVLPALSALLGSLEELSVGAEVEVLSYLVPLALLVRSGVNKGVLIGFTQQFVLLLPPDDSTFGLLDVEQLILEEKDVFTPESGAKGFPVAFAAIQKAVAF
jgi:hypothetical protein